MKRKIIITTIIWLVSIVVIVIALPNNGEEKDRSYKVTINRIHNQLTDNILKNLEIINNLSEVELKSIESIEMLELTEESEIKVFLQVKDVYRNPVIFKQIDGTTIIVRYDLKEIENKEFNYMILICMIMLGAYLFVISNILYTNKKIIKPMKRLTNMTKQIATGFIGEINLQYKNSYFKDFVWSLDMLREQLIYERDKNAKLEKQRKTLVASLSHDIKTPLSSIKNYSIALKDGIYTEDSEVENALDVILDKTSIIEKLTRELLDSSLKAVREIEVKLKEVYIKDIEKRLNRLIHQKIDLLQIEYQEPIIKNNIMVLVDIDRLMEVLDNIIENAIKYGDNKALRVSCWVEENYQLIEIFNTGAPIPETEIKHIFTSYYRGSNVNDKPGYGLGLYISKEIMKNMQGDIYAVNSYNGVSIIIVIKQAG